MREVQASVKIHSSEFGSKMGNVHPYPPPPRQACWCHLLLIRSIADWHKKQNGQFLIVTV